jgi:hypothetical protein
VPGNRVIALAGFVTAGALPAAATPGTFQYVALGDSYAAGQAAGSGNPLHLEGEQAIEEGAIPSKRLPQILGAGLLAV